MSLDIKWDEEKGKPWLKNQRSCDGK